MRSSAVPIGSGICPHSRFCFRIDLKRVAPDLPGLGVAGETFEETSNLMREAIGFHVEGLHADGEPVPEPTT